VGESPGTETPSSAGDHHTTKCTGAHRGVALPDVAGGDGASCRAGSREDGPDHRRRPRRRRREIGCSNAGNAPPRLAEALLRSPIRRDPLPEPRRRRGGSRFRVRTRHVGGGAFLHLRRIALEAGARPGSRGGLLRSGLATPLLREDGVGGGRTGRSPRTSNPRSGAPSSSMPTTRCGSTDPCSRRRDRGHGCCTSTTRD
jgi:hypothetical protein